MTRKLEFTIKAFIYSVPDGWPYFSFTYSLLVEKTATINEKFVTVQETVATSSLTGLTKQRDRISFSHYTYV
jgi:hypothetical protein